jgi:hypothetical protein
MALCSKDALWTVMSAAVNAELKLAQMRLY